MALFKFTNTLSAEEPAYKSGAWLVGGEGVDVDEVNPGAKTGPYGNGLRNNDLSIPLPRTNFQIKLPAGAEPIEIETTDTLEIEFFKALNETVVGLEVEEIPSDDEEETTEETVDDGQG